MSDPAQLVAAFAQTVGSPAAGEDLADALSTIVARARAEHPTVQASATEYARALGTAVADADDPFEALATIHAGDLWLAVAAADGDPIAVGRFDDVLTSLRPTLARMGAARSSIDELLQQIRVRLLTGSEERPARIRSFRGRSELRSWLKVIAVRDAVRTLRSARDAEAPAEEIETLMDPGGDPELAAMRGAYREAFRDAFGRALSGLSARDRNVLRYHLVEGLTIDDLGALYRVHRATAARWLAKIREGLFVATRTELMQRLEVGPDEVDSVIRLLRSRLDASIAGHLGPNTAS